MMDDDQVDVGWCIKREGEADIVGGELFSPTCRWHNVRTAIWRQLGPEQTRPANHAIVILWNGAEVNYLAHVQTGFLEVRVPKVPARAVQRGFYEFAPLDVPMGEDIKCLGDLLGLPVGNKVDIIVEESSVMAGSDLPSWANEATTTVHRDLWDRIKLVLQNEPFDRDGGHHMRLDLALSIINFSKLMQPVRVDISSTTDRLKCPNVVMTPKYYPPIVLVEEQGWLFSWNAIEELTHKFQRIPEYAKLPFVIGITVERDCVEFFKMNSAYPLTRTPASSDIDPFADPDMSYQTTWSNLDRPARAVPFDRGTFYLGDVRERIRLIQALINVGRYCFAVSIHPRKYMHPIGAGMYFHPMKCSSGAKLMKTFSYMIKKFGPNRSTDAVWVANMDKFYAETHHIPLVEHRINNKAIEHHKRPKLELQSMSLTFRLIPVGRPVGDSVPRFKGHASLAFRCIASALASLHKCGWTHNDVRWPNIVFVAQCDNRKASYILIDCEYAWPLGETYQYVHPRMSEFGLDDDSKCSVAFDVDCFVDLFDEYDEDLTEKENECVAAIREGTCSLANVEAFLAA